MRTKICLPNSPKKSLKHFVILKCLGNELEPLKGPFEQYASISEGSLFSNSVTARDVRLPPLSISGEQSCEIRCVESAPDLE